MSRRCATTGNSNAFEERSSSAALSRAGIDAHGDDAERELALPDRLVIVDLREEMARGRHVEGRRRQRHEHHVGAAHRFAQVLAMQPGRRIDHTPLVIALLVAVLCLRATPAIGGNNAGRRSSHSVDERWDRGRAARRPGACPRASRRHWSRALSCRCRLSDWRRESSASDSPFPRCPQRAILAPIPRLAGRMTGPMDTPATADLRHPAPPASGAPPPRPDPRKAVFEANKLRSACAGRSAKPSAHTGSSHRTTG